VFTKLRKTTISFLACSQNYEKRPLVLPYLFFLPIWTYGILLWGTASYSIIEILQRFQNKALRTMVNAPWYVPNKILHTDLQMPTIREEIMKFSTNHRAKLLMHPNNLTSNLLTEQGPGRLTLRRLMSYIYGAPILDVSRSHTTTQHSR